MYSDAHTEAVAVRVDHGLGVAGGVGPAGNSFSGDIMCAGEHGEVGAEALGIASGGGGFALLSVVPEVHLTRDGLGGIHQGVVHRKF